MDAIIGWSIRRFLQDNQRKQVMAGVMGRVERLLALGINVASMDYMLGNEYTSARVTMAFSQIQFNDREEFEALSLPTKS